MKKFQLGEFEEIVILTIGILNNEAYSVSIKDEIESRLSRTVSMGALHTALVRLEDKGYIKSVDGESTEERAGRPKKYFQITALGKKAMEHSRNIARFEARFPAFLPAPSRAHGNHQFHQLRTPFWSAFDAPFHSESRGVAC